jgi:hypothetical protein
VRRFFIATSPDRANKPARGKDEQVPGMAITNKSENIFCFVLSVIRWLNYFEVSNKVAANGKVLPKCRQ